MARFPDVGAVLFDLDGTLVDSVPDLADAVNATLAALGHGPLPEDEVAHYLGRGVDALLHRALTRSFDGTVEPARLARARALFDPAYARLNGHRSTVYPGVADGLAGLETRGFALGCVTNKPHAAAVALLGHFDLLRYFDVVIGGDSLPERKPRPEPLWAAAAGLGVPATHCLVVGDSANDAEAARAAGMPVVLMTYGYREGRCTDDIDCDGWLDSLARLPDQLDGPTRKPGAPPAT